MRRSIFGACILVTLLVVLAPGVASAQYVSPPGQGPDVGGTDTGELSREFNNNVVTDDVPGEVTPPAGNVPTEVQGRRFAREISSSSGFALAWLWLLLAFALLLAFLILWRRRRDEEEEAEFGGAQPA